MSEERSISPPQPIPYPENEIIRKLYRAPILLYRLGLGKLFRKYIVILSSFGRKSGKIHRTPVEYFQENDRIYVMSGFGDTPDWYQNLQKNPYTTLNKGKSSQQVIARKPETQSEWEGVIKFLKTSPVTNISDPEMVKQLDNPQVLKEIKEWPVLTFDGTQEPCPTPLEIDLAWTWPLILLFSAHTILLRWIKHRRRRV